MGDSDSTMESLLLDPDVNATTNSTALEQQQEKLKNLLTRLIPAMIFGVLLLTCITAILFRNVVRYFSNRNCSDSVQLAAYDEQMKLHSSCSNDQFEDAVSPQNAKQLVVDSKMTDVMYS